MAPVQEKSMQRKLLLVQLLLLFTISSLISAAQSQHHTPQTQNHHHFTRKRILLQLEDDDDEPIIIKKSSSPTKNQTKLIKPSPNSSSKNQTKPIIKNSSNLSLKNQTKLTTKTSNSSPKNQTKLTKSSNLSPKNQTKLTKSSNLSPKNQTKLTKSSNLSPKNQTKTTIDNSSPPAKTTTTTKTQIKKLNTTSNPAKKQSDQPKPTSIKIKTTKPTDLKKTQKKIIPVEEEDDFVSEFTDLPSRFQETFLPDMEKITMNSKIYLDKYNKEFEKGFKPYVGNKYASTLASIISFAFIIIPLILVSLIFTKIKAYFSLQKILIFIQIYLSIYFTILGLSSLITGLEPLKFFYATSHSTYVCVQVLQTLGYLLYLLLLLMYLVLVFSTETGLGPKLLGLAQTFVGFAVGLHYYITVFHRAVLHQPPKASWKVHALYATCFVVICLLARLERRKKAYLEEGGEEGKKS